MSSPPDDYLYTAKTISIRKFENPARCLTPADTDCGEWARDLHTHITRIMPTSPPYDHTMPRPSPQTKIQVDTPRPSISITEVQAIVNDSSAATCTRTPRPPRNVARDGLYHALKRSASFPPRDDLTSTSRQSRQNFCSSGFDALSKRVQTQHKQVMRQQHKLDTTPKKDKPKPNLTLKKEKLNTKLLPTGLDIHSEKAQAFHKKIMRHDEQEILNAIASSKPTVPTPTSPPKPNLSPLAKPLLWANSLCKKRRPSEIFNLSFNFNTPSRRPAGSHTPQISPRTSISSSSPSSTHPTEESWKRQKRTSTSTSTSTPPLIPSTPSFIPTHTEAHPGLPVDFSTPHTPPAEPECEAESYHAWLEESRRWSSSSCSDGDVVPIDIGPHESSYSQGCQYPYPYAYASSHPHSHTPTTNDESSRILGLSTYENPHPRARNEFPSPCSLISPSPSPCLSVSSYKSTEVSKVMSTSPSADRFLTHVRASQEARALMKTPRHFVFVDEEEAWGWGGGPL